MATHLTAVSTPANEATMALPNQINSLRNEHGWPQADLAARINTDVGQISRYENGKITPSVEAVIRRPYRAPADPLLERLTDLDTLIDTDRADLLHILENLIANTRIRAALHNAS